MDIKKYRENKHLTQQEVADLLDITLRQYSRIEKDPSATRITTLKQLIRLFDINEKDILDFMKYNEQIEFTPEKEQIETEEELDMYYYSFEPRDKIDSYILSEKYEDFFRTLF